MNSLLERLSLRPGKDKTRSAMDKKDHNDTSQVIADIEDQSYGELSLTVGRDVSFQYLENFGDLAANELRGIKTEEESPHVDEESLYVDEETDGELDDDHVHNFIMEIYFTEQSSKILIVSVESCSEEAVDNVPTVLALSNEKDEENELNELKRKLKAAEEKIEKLEDNNETQSATVRTEVSAGGMFSLQHYTSALSIVS